MKVAEQALALVVLLLSVAFVAVMLATLVGLVDPESLLFVVANKAVPLLAATSLLLYARSRRERDDR